MNLNVQHKPKIKRLSLSLLPVLPHCCRSPVLSPGQQTDLPVLTQAARQCVLSSCHQRGTVEQFVAPALCSHKKQTYPELVGGCEALLLSRSVTIKNALPDTSASTKLGDPITTTPLTLWSQPCDLPIPAAHQPSPTGQTTQLHLSPVFLER